MLREIVKVNFNPASSADLNLGQMDSSFTEVMMRGGYHINFAGHDQSLVYENLKSDEIKTIGDLSEAMKQTVSENSIEGIQSLIFTFIGDAMNYAHEPIDYEFCVEIK